MKKKILLFLSAAVLCCAAVSFAEEKPTGSASVAFMSQYLFRGYEISKHSLVIQPNIAVTYEGVSAGLWANLDTDEHATRYFTPTEPGRTNLNECDLSLSYARAVGKAALTGGYYYYGTDYASQTQEVFVSGTYDTIAKPTLAVYRDIGKFHAFYTNLSVSHSLALTGETTLDLGASAGYVYGDSNAYRTNGGAGSPYRALHDGMVKAGLTIPAGKLVTVQPAVQYWFPLSSKAKRDGYNPFGRLDDTVVYGVALTMNF